MENNTGKTAGERFEEALNNPEIPLVKVTVGEKTEEGRFAAALVIGTVKAGEEIEEGVKLPPLPEGAEAYKCTFMIDGGVNPEVLVMAVQACDELRARILDKLMEITINPDL